MVKPLVREESGERPRPRVKTRRDRTLAEAAEDFEHLPWVKWLRVIGCAIGALILIGMTVKLHFDISALESGTLHSVKVWKPAALAYEWGGRWPAMGVMSLLTLLAVAGIPMLAYDAMTPTSPKTRSKKRRSRR